MDEAPSEHTGDLDALFAEVNNLPADDPLRGNGERSAASAFRGQRAGLRRAAAGATPRSRRLLAASAHEPAIPVHAAEAKKEPPPLRRPRPPPTSLMLRVMASWSMPRTGSAFLLSWVNRCGWLSRRPERPAWRCRLWAAVSPGSRFPHPGAWCLPVPKLWSASLARIERRSSLRLSHMGREATCHCKWGAEEGDCKVLLEGSELILRSGLRRRVPLSAMAGVAARGRSWFSTSDRTMWNWVSVLKQPSDGRKPSHLLLPALASKLGISRTTRLSVVGDVKSEELKAAIAEAGAASGKEVDLILICVNSQSE